MTDIPQLNEVESAVARFISELTPVSSEEIALESALGRVLAQPVMADRDSPALDVSAMDGYAVRLDSLRSSLSSEVVVTGVAAAGHPPVDLQPNCAVQIFTGAVVPRGADCVIRREDTAESSGSFRLNPGCLESLRPGQNIRYQGENVRAGQVVLSAGTEINCANVGALATFAPPIVRVHRRLTVAVLTSGDELVAPGQSVQAWQIRDSNGPTLAAWIAGLPWLDLGSQQRVGDSLARTKERLTAALAEHDVVILTGGVSAGDTDYVPTAITELGGRIVFHRLRIRPGKPVLGAVLGGKAIVGLPGNPVSTAITARVIVQPVLEWMAGKCPPVRLSTQLINSDEKRLPLIWYRLVKMTAAGAELVDSRGSGDLVSMAGSDGFVELPVGASGSGPWRLWLW